MSGKYSGVKSTTLALESGVKVHSYFQVLLPESKSYSPLLLFITVTSVGSGLAAVSPLLLTMTTTDF